MRAILPRHAGVEQANGNNQPIKEARHTGELREKKGGGGGAARSRTGLNGFAIRRITALLPRLKSNFQQLGLEKREALGFPFQNLERDKRLELSTYTLARYRSTN